MSFYSYILLPALLFSSPFFFSATPTTEIYTLSLHDALPILSLGPVLFSKPYPLTHMAPTRINRFRIKAFLFFITLLLCVFSGQSARAQFIHHVPEDHPNSRFMTDVSHIEMRPQLTFAGFSGENSRALGLQQFLNHAADDSGNPAFATLEKIIEMAGQSIPQDPDI